MDSVSHIWVANLVMDYVEQTCGVTFDTSGFLYGNLKPDLKGTYLTKRHYPSLMMDEVLEKIRVFTHKYKIGPTNGRELSVDLGEICHFMTDFFTYPHNDDIYEHNLLAHYIYEKRIALVIRKRLSEKQFEKWVSPLLPPVTLESLIVRIREMHEAYRTGTQRHCIGNDLMHICRATTMLVLSMVNIVYEHNEQPAAVIA